jgi:hypothetical protein
MIQVWMTACISYLQTYGESLPVLASLTIALVMCLIA